MRSSITALAALCLAAPPLAAQSSAREDALRSIVAAERGFAAMARTRGIDSAFYLNIADDGVLFRPGPVNGKTWLARNMSPRGAELLVWDPRWADVAASGELGYTTGPYEFRARGETDSVVARGSFITVWRKQRDGTWRFLIDLGSGGTATLAGDAAVRSPRADASAPAPWLADAAMAALRDSILTIDRALGDRGASDVFAGRLGALLTAESRVYRARRAPSIGALPTAAPNDGDTYSSTPLDGHLARSGDFALTYGTYERTRDGAPTERGDYQRIWKRRADGRWALAVDVASPAR